MQCLIDSLSRRLDVKTSGRTDGSLDIVYLACSFECFFDSLLFIYLHYRFYDTRGNCSERYFDSWDQERMIDTIFLTNL